MGPVCVKATMSTLLSIFTKKSMPPEKDGIKACDEINIAFDRVQYNPEAAAKTIDTALDRKSVEKDPHGCVMLWTARAMIAAYEKEDQLARQCLEKALSINPNDLRALNKLTSLMLKADAPSADDMRRARDLLTRASTLDPSCAYSAGLWIALENREKRSQSPSGVAPKL